MAKLSDAEKKDLIELAAIVAQRDDRWIPPEYGCRLIGEDGQVDIDKWIEFLTEYNAFINHEPRPFAPMIERDMKM